MHREVKGSGGQAQQPEGRCPCIRRQGLLPHPLAQAGEVGGDALALAAAAPARPRSRPAPSAAPSPAPRSSPPPRTCAHIRVLAIPPQVRTALLHVQCICMCYTAGSLSS